MPLGLILVLVKARMVSRTAVKPVLGGQLLATMVNKHTLKVMTKVVVKTVAKVEAGRVLTVKARVASEACQPDSST
jgi:hypothetical protein